MNKFSKQLILGAMCLALVASAAMAGKKAPKPVTKITGCFYCEVPSVDCRGCLDYCNSYCCLIKSCCDLKTCSWVDTGSCCVDNESCKQCNYKCLPRDCELACDLIECGCEYWCTDPCDICWNSKKSSYCVSKKGVATLSCAGTY